jgi:hypothetical protein
MSALPTLKIPVVVNTEQVPVAMKKVERTVADSAQRISRIRASITPSLGALGAGPVGGMLSGVGGLGGGFAGAAVGIGLGMAPFLAASKMMKIFEAESKGATDALAKFNETGTQVFAANSTILKRLADMEQQTARGKTPSLAQAFTGAFATGAEESTVGYIARTLDEFSSQVAAYTGAVLSGKGTVVAGMEAELATAGEARAKDVNRAIREQKRIEEAEPWAGIEAPLSAMAEFLLRNSVILEKINQATI